MHDAIGKPLAGAFQALLILASKSPVPLYACCDRIQQRWISQASRGISCLLHRLPPTAYRGSQDKFQLHDTGAVDLFDLAAGV